MPEAAQQDEALILGALGDSSGALADVLAGGAVTGSAEDVLAQAQGVGVATSGAGNLRTRSGGGGSGEPELLHGDRNVIDSGEDIGGSGDFDQAQVTQMIRRRQSAFRRCYETRLRENPALAGKVSVQFTIQESGSVSGARHIENTSNDAALASCVVGVVARLRWNPGPDGGSVTFSYPFVFAPQN